MEQTQTKPPLLRIAIASALGALSGTLLAISLNAFWWIGTLVGALVGYLVYNPRTVWSELKEETNRRIQNARASFQKMNGKNFLQDVGMFSVIVLFLADASIALMGWEFLINALPLYETSQMIELDAVASALIFFCLTLGFTVLYLNNLMVEGAHIFGTRYARLARVEFLWRATNFLLEQLERIMNYGEDTLGLDSHNVVVWTVKKRYFSVSRLLFALALNVSLILFLSLLPLLIIISFLLTLTDIALTVLLACASSHRIAAGLGAFSGCLIGSLAWKVLGILPQQAILFATFVGGISGLGLATWRHHLETTLPLPLDN